MNMGGSIMIAINRFKSKYVALLLLCFFFTPTLYSESNKKKVCEFELLKTIQLKTIMNKVNNWHLEDVFINYDSFFISDDPPNLIWGFSHAKSILNQNNTYSHINDLLICNKDSLVINYNNFNNSFHNAQYYLGLIRGFDYDNSTKKKTIVEDDCINCNLEIFKTSKIKTEIENCYDVISYSNPSANIVTVYDHYTKQYFLINKTNKNFSNRYSICYFESYSKQQIFELRDQINDMIDSGFRIIGFCKDYFILNDTKQIVIYNFRENQTKIIDLEVYFDQLGLSEYKLPPEYIIPYGLFVNDIGIYMFLHCKKLAYIYFLEL